MTLGPKGENAVRELERRLLPGAGALAVIDRTAEALLQAVPSDVWCGVILDPSTRLDTGGQHKAGFPQHVMPGMFEIEYAEQDDVDNIRALARRSSPVSVLSDSTRGRLETSKYYREILRPLDLADEMRVMLSEDGRTWGLLVLCRARRAPAFTAADKAVAAAMSAPASTALRRSLLLSGVDRRNLPDAPGLVLLDGDLTVRSMTPTAQQWIDLLQEDRPRRTGNCPYVVYALAARASAEAAAAEPGTPVRSRAPGRSGQWMALDAWAIDQDAERLVAVSIGPVPPGDLAAIILDAYGLSKRERDITQQVLLGRSTSEIAQCLHLSAYTVQDHLKAIFDKTGVRSRRELIADLFFRHYLPQLARPPLSTDGRLLRAASPRPGDLLAGA